MRRRRRFKGTWLPNLGTVDTQASDEIITAGKDIELDISSVNLKPIVGVIPLTQDAPQENQIFTPDVPLVYFIGNGYALRRIVGKVFADFRTSVVPTTENMVAGGQPPAALVTCAFFVARAGDDDENQDLPIDGLATDGLLRNYNPDTPDCIREPWIWRRQWILGNPLVKEFLDDNPATASFNTGLIAAYYPPNTSSYGSVSDGPHIDCRTRRRVSSDDRLWFAAVAQPYPRRSAGYTIPSQVNIHLDYRLFGALRRDRNRGTF